MWMYDSYVFLCGSWGHNAKPIFSKNTHQKKKKEKKQPFQRVLFLDIYVSWCLNKINNTDKNESGKDSTLFKQFSEA